MWLVPKVPHAMRNLRHSISRIYRRLCIGILSVLVPVLVSAGTTADMPEDSLPQEERPTIGLVLGGGGALGLAHVGVLKVLEEYRIPVDFITGTSMGAIIGAWYALGMPPEEIEATVKAIDWWDLLDDDSARKSRDMRRKRDDVSYLSDLEIGVRMPGRISFPPGLASGQKLELLMRRETRSAADVESFDELNVPFRAVATDLYTGDMVVMDRGALDMAIRASMAVPGAFTPVEWEGRTLVDGGIVNNVPVEVAREMGADTVIAVDVVSAKAEALVSDISHFTHILARTYVLMKKAALESQLEMADYVIMPELRRYSAGSFHRADRIISRGERAARAYSNELAQLSVPLEEYAQYLETQRRSPPKPLRVTGVRIEGNKHRDERALLARIRTEPSAEVSLREIERDVERLHGLGDYKRVTYSLEPSEEGYEVVYTVQEKTWGPGYLYLGFRMESNFDDKWNRQLLFKYIRKHMNRFGGELHLDGEVGTNQRVETEWYQPVVPSAIFFVALGGRGDWFDTAVYERDERVATYDVARREGALSVGVNFREMASLSAGIRSGHARVTINPDLEETDEFDGGTGGFTTDFLLDRLDHVFFPRRGNLIRAEGYWSRSAAGAREEYDKVSAEYRHYVSTRSHTMHFGGMVGSAVGGELPIYDLFAMGGIDTMAAYPRHRFTGSHAALIQIGYRYELYRLPPAFGRGVYAMLRYDAGNAWNERRDMKIDDLRHGGALALAADTKIGPCMAGIGFAEGGNHQVFVSIGLRF